jgi:hypothetical protein
MELFGAVIGLSVVTWIMIAVVLGLLFPAFWLWMLIDSLIRDTGAYPGRDVSEKVLWVLLMLVFQPSAVLYFFLVWKQGRSAERPATPSSATPVAA